MASSTTLSKSKGPILDPGLCRCCRSIKRCRLLTSAYEWSGQKEVYVDMFMDCFGLLLSHLDEDVKQTGICATCVTRLRDALAFRIQVLNCEELFLNSLQENLQDANDKMEIEVKTEPYDSDNDRNVSPLAPLVSETDKKPAEGTPNIELNWKPEFKDVTRRETRSKTRENNRATSEKLKELKAQLELTQNVPDDETRERVHSTESTKLSKESKTKSLRRTKVKKVPLKKNKEKSTSTQRNHMLYENAVTIVENSYVCPFLNRISIYYCYYCRDQYTNPNELREHTLTHNPRKAFESMMEYKKIPKIDITRIDCRLCAEKINDLDALKSHLTHAHEKKFYPVANEFLKFKLTMDNLACTECNETFPYFDVLKKHMINHFGRFTCDMCGACFLEESSLRTHIKSHSKVEAFFPCEICGKTLKSKYSKYLHIATIHEKRPTVNCYKCEASFLSHALRNKHLIEAHGDERRFPCKLCDKVYNRRKTLNEHNRRNHLMMRKHQCEYCDEKFYLPSRLKDHMATHTGERNFHCEYCNKSYPRLKSLRQHIGTHNNIRPYKCDVCNHTFTQNGSLKTHIKSQHPGYELEPGFQ